MSINEPLTFNGEHYLQKRGTAIGTKMAPSYANLFMHKIESGIIDSFPYKPVTWMRYIDDIFFVWMNGEESLKLFMNHMNNYHDTIKFTFNWSTEEVDFLDVTVKLNDGIIQTDLYTKPTDKHQYLFFTSCHPSASKKGIPYAQALRIRRICSEDELFEKRANESN